MFVIGVFHIFESGGLRISDVVNWYLKEIENEIDTEEELAQRKILVERVIDRLINYVSLIDNDIWVQFTDYR